MQPPEMCRGSDVGLIGRFSVPSLASAPQQCGFVDGIPAAYATALFDGDYPQMSAKAGSCVYRMTLGAARSVWAAVFDIEIPMEAHPLEVYGRKLIVGVHVPSTPFFPVTPAYAAWCSFDVVGECQMTRLVGGYPIWPPMLGSAVKVFLPGEPVAATCLYVHKDGSWEGKIVGLTVNEMTSAQIRLLNRSYRLSGTPFELIADRHGYRRGHVVRWRLGEHNAWVPGEPAGGMA